MSAPLTTAEATKVTPLPLDPRTYDRALSCVHCGLCLPACPTYTQTGHEGDSPRGRIQLMRGLADGVIGPSETVKKHLDLCLDCRACETACPSGVVYHELIEETRERMARGEKPTGGDRFMRWVFFNVFVNPTRLKWALLPARVMQKVGLYGLLRKSGVFKLLPAQLRKMEQMLPAKGAVWPRRLPAFMPARASARAPIAHDPKVRVAFFPGCIGSVMFNAVNRQAIELLNACGADVVAPRAQVCCGAIHHHNGEWETAKAFARRNIDAVGLGTSSPAWIATNIAGCGAMLKDYDHLLRDDPVYAERAKEYVAKVRDISEVLAELLPPEILKHPVPLTVTYHDACHLAHAQKVTSAPRKLLAAIPGLTLVPLAESDMCCGAAGTYNLTQPGMATDLAERKLKYIAATGATVCAAGNVGCAMHIQSEADARGQRVDVVHPVELLHRAVFGCGDAGRPS
jgi:glycolate oxidase iron-sulfur subunit